ncbi:MAG: hypothetical protein IJM83_08290 [Firmicutes bacterium]|nr:hypothetical protein [Bacillota bacterium]
MKTNNPQLVKRILMTVFGVSICGLSVGLFSYSDLGLDPFQVFAHGTWSLTGIGFGTFYMLLNIVQLIVIFIVDRKKISLGTLINLFLLGYMAEFSEACLVRWLGPSVDHALWFRVIVLAVGVVIMCLSTALYFTADLGVSTYDAIAIILDEKKAIKIKGRPVPFKYIRIGTDVICVIIGGLLGATVGIGTVIAAFFMGPLIAFFKKTVAEPILRR